MIEAKPDIVAIAALPEPASKLVHELRHQGFTGRIISSQLAADPAIVDLLGTDGDGTLLVASFWKGRTAQSAAFDKTFVAENAKRGIRKLGAHHSDAQTYDAVYLIKDLMEKAHVTGDPAKLVEEREAIVGALKGIRFSGIIGDDICFTGHDAELPGYIIEIKNGQWTKFDEVPANKCPETARMVVSGDLSANYSRAYGNRIGLRRAAGADSRGFRAGLFRAGLRTLRRSRRRAGLGAPHSRGGAAGACARRADQRRLSSHGAQRRRFTQKALPLRHFVQGSPMGAWPAGLRAEPDELVISKQYPSAIFGTSLASDADELRRRHADHHRPDDERLRARDLRRRDVARVHPDRRARGLRRPSSRTP